MGVNEAATHDASDYVPDLLDVTVVEFLVVNEAEFLACEHAVDHDDDAEEEGDVMDHDGDDEEDHRWDSNNTSNKGCSCSSRNLDNNGSPRNICLRDIHVCDTFPPEIKIKCAKKKSHGKKKTMLGPTEQQTGKK